MPSFLTVISNNDVWRSKKGEDLNFLDQVKKKNMTIVNFIKYRTHMGTKKMDRDKELIICKEDKYTSISHTTNTEWRHRFSSTNFRTFKYQYVKLSKIMKKNIFFIEYLIENQSSNR